jgi:colicin import membrane protein
MASVDAGIDQLFQGPLGEFTAARNALAKRAGDRAADVKGLQKPTLAAWAVNQLYWQRRAVYDDLVDRAADVRATHQATLKGQRTDLRGASRAHEEAVDRAFKATLTLLSEAGQPVTDATRQAIATTLRALPGDEPPGRLTRQLEPRAFDALAGLSVQGRVRPPAPAGGRPGPPAPARAKGSPDAAGKEAAARLQAARDAWEAARRDARDAEHVVRREEFEIARTLREMEKHERRVREAEEALRQAEADLAEARRDAERARTAHADAGKRASEAAAALKAARRREEAAQRALKARDQ